ncbi:MAG: 2-C-methyl-D-erythritol 4-phosphate cytidylyltransferase [Erysipelotrichaceae bacterium]|nr:2-C-methyl-D-erythritol 4-phosphate cytidylyltransferase [Erysipelotrichaceae bacterium]
MKYSCVLCAAGSGSRMNLGYNKVFYPIFEDKTVLDLTISVFEQDPDCNEIIVVTQKENFKRIHGSDKIKLAEGSSTRSLSVFEGLKCVTNEVVMIHDGARPYVTLKNLQDIKACLTHCDACLLAVPCVDTIKVVKDGVVVQTPKRSDLWNAQTPQAFKTSLIQQAYQKSFDLKIEVSDDASCVELCTDVPVHIVPGDYQNIKITNPQDLKLQK